MQYPYWKQGPLTQPVTFYYKLTMKKLEKNRHMRDRLHLSAAILAQWQPPVASIKALDLLHWAMRTVSYRRTAAAIKMARKVCPFFCHCFICYCPGGCWGNTERVVARWRRSVAYGVARDMLHQAMPSVLLQCTCMAIKNGLQWRCIHFLLPLFLLTVIVAKDHVMIS
jgi:hypothetical protein